MNEEYLRVKPAAGLKVLRPDGSVLPAEGAEVPRTSYWLRRMADGSVTIIRGESGPKGKGK